MALAGSPRRISIAALAVGRETLFNNVSDGKRRADSSMTVCACPEAPDRASASSGKRHGVPVLRKSEGGCRPFLGLVVVPELRFGQGFHPLHARCCLLQVVTPGDVYGMLRELPRFLKLP